MGTHRTAPMPWRIDDGLTHPVITHLRPVSRVLYAMPDGSTGVQSTTDVARTARTLRAAGAVITHVTHPGGNLTQLGRNENARL